MPPDLEVGDKFAFVTRTGRMGYAEVLAVSNPVNPQYPYFLRWYDEHGKHYEWFDLDEFETLEFQ